MRSRAIKRPGPLLHQQRLHRAREQRRMEAWHQASLNSLAQSQETLAALHAATQEARHA